MTAVASPPTFTQHNRPTWGMNGMNGGHSGQMMNPDELNRMFMPRKSLQRNNSSSSISSTSSASSTSTVITPNTQQNGTPMPPQGDLTSWQNSSAAAAAATRKRPQPKAPWPAAKPEPQSDFVRITAGRPQSMAGMNGAAPVVPSQGQMTATQQGMPRPYPESLPPGNQPVLCLLSLNGTFERKNISVPFSPDTLRIGRQTNAKTVPTPINGFFDSKVLSRQHAEIHADRQGKIWIRDVKSSNGTFVNGTRLSQENRESDPHELQTGDHLELGIDIVNEDQKTVVHHKVAAKVEHAGFTSNSNNLLDVNFGDLDPANGSMMMMGPQGGAARQRAGSQASMASNGRMVQAGMMAPQANGMSHQRGGFFFSPISTEQIVKRLQHEMRTARLQNQDLGRTGHFVHALLSKEEIKHIEKPEASEPQKANAVNGNSMSFRADNKTRFSDPPAPPPQAPLPEKPDVPSLKRGITERPKTHAQSMSPIRQDGNVSQILQLTEALNSAKREIESQSTRMRDLEDMLQKERAARLLAEELAKRLEDASSPKVNGTSTPANIEEAALEAAFEPPSEETNSNETTVTLADVERNKAPDAEVIEASASHLQAQLESMVSEMRDLRQQLELFKHRAEKAEAERDSDRKSLAEMAIQIRKDAEAKEMSNSEDALTDARALQNVDRQSEIFEESSAMARTSSTDSARAQMVAGENSDHTILSRTATITPETLRGSIISRDQVLANSIPYASMMGVVLIGMGLMAYINGWQPQTRMER
ncbi:hypothetical protein F5Y15DRAFT_162502 [Xylariaceae sp. FL0016]|nr:hypothetical protein F5Y15DRAFT_162502 [Xylariaceae sp. FL0016]